MNSTSFDDEQSEQLLSAYSSSYASAAVGETLAKEVPTVSTNSKSPTSTDFFDQKIKFSNETKKESITETDDSFDLFLPLKVKNYKNGLKKPNTTSTNKFKKKKVTSSNRICPYFSTRRSPISTKEDRDLKLAIERSLEDISPSKSSGGVLSDIVNENKPSDTVIERKPIKQPPNFLKSSTSKTKKLSKNTLLLRRTGEERQEIIIKKIGILLLEKENFHDQVLEKLQINLISSNLEEAWDKDSTLWELSKIEVNNVTEFYVSKLEKFIDKPSVVIDQPSVVIDQPLIALDQPSVAVEQPIATMSDAYSVKENDNAVVSSNDMNVKIEDDNAQLKDNSSKKFDEIKGENNSECSSTCELDFSKRDLSVKDEFLADSLNILSDDLNSLFGSRELSDFNIILKSGESLPCHQIMLQARCPYLLSSVFITEVSNSLDFSEYSSQATRAFFKFIYTGQLNFIYDLTSEEKSDLYVLAKKYKLTFLENFLLKSFSSDSFHVYSQSTCSPPGSPTKDFPDSSHASKKDVQNKPLGIPALALESFEKDKENFSILKENKGNILSFANLAETINNFASTSGLNSSKKIGNESLYDIFKDEIKSPCNSSLLSQSFQSKRKLDYTEALKENKKVCSENIPEVVMIDSDSNEACLSVSSNSSKDAPVVLNLFLEDDNKQPINEDLFENSSNSSDLNITGYFNRSVEEVHSEPTKISPISTDPYSNISLTPLRSSPQLVKTLPPSKDRSIDKYFEPSFPEVNENIEAMEKFSQQISLATPPVNKNLPKKILTPLQEIIIGEATPKPDYDAMVSPELKDALRKYGIKPTLDPRKARCLLQYIYEQIHPIKTELPNSDIDPLPSTSKERSLSPVVATDNDSSQSDPSDPRKW